MNCPNCGTENSPHARFCRQCGFDIKSVPVEKPEQPINASVASGDTPTIPSQAAVNPSEIPVNPAHREEIVVPLPTSTTPAQPPLAGIPIPPVAFSMPAAPLYAGFWLRLAASFIDGLLIFAASLILFLPIAIILGVFSALARMSQSTMSPIISLYSFITNVMGTILGWLYYAGMESSSRQATIGKLAVGIKVVGLDGKRISFGRATGRYFAKIVNAFTLGIGYLTIVFTEKKQALHDMIAGTLVVKK